MLALNEEQLLPLSRATLPLLQVGWDKQTPVQRKAAKSTTESKGVGVCPCTCWQDAGGWNLDAFHATLYITGNKNPLPIGIYNAFLT